MFRSMGKRPGSRRASLTEDMGPLGSDDVESSAESMSLSSVSSSVRVLYLSVVLSLYLEIIPILCNQIHGFLSVYFYLPLDK